MAARRTGPFKLHNPWVKIGWLSAAGLLAVSILLGFVLLGRAQQNGPALGPWSAFCSALGISPDIGPAEEPQPPLRTPSRVAWTRDTLAQIADGNTKQGAFVAMNCTACHGEQGVSSSGLYPTLAGMDAAAIYKQLDDYRVDKRSWGAMNGIAQAPRSKLRPMWRCTLLAAETGWHSPKASVLRAEIRLGKTRLPFAWRSTGCARGTGRPLRRPLDPLGFPGAGNRRVHRGGPAADHSYRRSTHPPHRASALMVLAESRSER
jgi:cytochrome c553